MTPAQAQSVQMVEISVGSRIVWLDALTALAEDLAKHTGLDEDGCFAVAMAIREAVSNAMVHGNRRDESKLVQLTFLIHAERLEIRVKDEGPGFDSGELPDPLAPQNLMRASGRGVFLMRSYMDELDLERVARRGGEIRMFKNLPARDGQASGPEDTGPSNLKPSGQGARGRGRHVDESGD